jgi:hypothetical protein
VDHGGLSSPFTERGKQFDHAAPEIDLRQPAQFGRNGKIGADIASITQPMMSGQCRLRRSVELETPRSQDGM